MGNADTGNKRKKGLFGFGEPGPSRLIPLFLLALFCVSFATDAIAAYRSSTGTGLTSSPKIRNWNSTTSTWGPEVELPSAGPPIRYLQIKISPILDKTIIVTQSDDGYIDAYVCAANCGSAGSWALSSNIGQVWATAPAVSSRRFDVNFESSSGNAMVVYGVVSTNTARDIAYKVLPQASTSFTGITEQYIDDPGHATDLQYTWLYLDSKPGGASDEMILTGFDGTSNDVNAWVWNGASWVNYVEISPNPASTGGYEAIFAQYSSNGSQGMVAGANGNNGQVNWAYWSGAAWSAVSNFDADGTNGDVRWITMKADPVSKGIQLVAITSSSYLDTAYWNGSVWAVTSNIDTGVDVNTARSADFEWSPTGSTGRLVWDTDGAGTTLSQRACSPQCTGTTSTISTYAGTGVWLAMRANPTSTDAVKILGLRLNSALGIGSFRFDGSTFTNYGDSILTSTTTTSVYEAYDLAFYKRDTIPPAIGAITVLPSYVSGSTFVSGSSNISAVASDAGSGINASSCEYTLNGGASWIAAPYSGGSCIANNVNTASASSINMRAKDNAGNQGNGTAVPVTVDTAAPTTTANGNGYVFNAWANSSVTVTLTCNDGAGSGCAAIRYCTDTLNSCTPSTTYGGGVVISTGGVSYIRYSSVDNVGNAESAKNQTIRIDNAAPTTTATAIKNDSTSYTFNTWTNSSYVNATLSCNDGTGSGCGTTLYCADAINSCTPSTPYSSAVQISTAGVSYMRYRSNDTSGNIEAIKNQTIRIDTLSPAINYTANSELAGAYVNRAWAYFEISYVEPNPANCTLNLNGTIYAMARNSTHCYLNATGLQAGYYIYNVTMNDTFGNSNRTENRNLTIATSLQIFFVPPTGADNSFLVGNSSYVNASISGFGQTSAFIDFNRSLMGFWNFDNVSGNAIYDVSTYGNHGANSNGAITPGKFGNGISFNGVNTSVDCGKAPSLNMTEEVSMEAWIKLNVVGQDQKIGGKQDGVSGGYKFGVYSDNKFEFEIRDAANASYLSRSVPGGALLQAGQWYHVVSVYSHSGDYIKTYVNGVLDRTLSPVGGALATTTSNLTLGKEPFGTVFFFNGTMDEVRVWNRVLSEAEINASYNAALYPLGRNFTNLSDGNYSFYAYAADTVGNSNRTETRRVFRDGIPPSTSASAIENDGSPYVFNVATPSIYVNVTLSCSDAVSGCNRTLYCNDSSDTCVPSIVYSGPVKISGNGTAYIRYYSVDRANNSEAINSRTIIIAPGTMIGSCNLTLVENSINYLSGDLFAGNYSCLTISQPNVTLDCENHRIMGGGTGFDNGAGILVAANLATIRNCRIEMFVSGIGVYYSNYNSISNIYAFNNTMGILLQGASQNAINNITAFQNNLGIYLQYSAWNNLTSINIQNNTYGIYVYADSINNTQSNITSINNTYG